MKTLPLAAATAFMLVLLVAPMVTSAATYAVTVTTDMSSYSGSEAVHVSGSVSPSPGASQAVSFTVTNPGGTSYPLPGTANIDPTTGDFTFVFNTGGTYYTASGSYTLTAEYDGNFGSTTFSYTPSSGGSSGISSAQYSNLIGNLTIVQHQLVTLQNDLAGNSSKLSGSISSLSSAISSLSTSLTGISSSLTSLTNTVNKMNATVSTLGSQVSSAASKATTAANDISTTQTYVLVVAVLAAITLVLELAVLVRKLS